MIPTCFISSGFPLVQCSSVIFCSPWLSFSNLNRRISSPDHLVSGSGLWKEEGEGRKGWKLRSEFVIAMPPFSFRPNARTTLYDEDRKEGAKTRLLIPLSLFAPFFFPPIFFLLLPLGRKDSPSSGEGEGIFFLTSESSDIPVFTLPT